MHRTGADIRTSHTRIEGEHRHRGHGYDSESLAFHDGKDLAVEGVLHASRSFAGGRRFMSASTDIAPETILPERCKAEAAPAGANQ